MFLAGLTLFAPCLSLAIFIEQEGSDSQACEFARERAGRLRPRLEGLIDEADRSLALDYVAEHSATVADAQAWNNFAAGANLLGQHRVAAWAGLEAVKREWFSPYVSNAGVLLLSAGENQAGFAFLNCAYAMGHRSPYLFEALAAYHYDEGNQPETERWIGLAREAAPDDIVIETEASVVQTGKPPPEPEPPDLPPIDQCIEELEEHHDNVLAALNKQVRQAEQLKWDQASQMAIRPQYFPKTIGLKQVRDARDRAAMSRDAFREMLRASGNTGTFTEQGYRQSRRMFADSALSFCIQIYFQITEQLLQASIQFGVELVFWADVLGVPPSVLARESRRQQSKAELISSKPHRYEIRIEGPRSITERSRLDYWGAPWTTVPLLSYRHEKLEADVALWETLDLGFGSGGYRSELGPPAYRRWCSAVKPAYQSLWTELDTRYRRVSLRYDQVASRMLWWGANQIEDARLFAQEYLAHMQGAPDAAAAAVNLWYMRLAGFVTAGPGSSRLSSIIAFLDEQSGRYQKWQTADARTLQLAEQDIARACTPSTIREALEQLTDKELQALLEELNRRSFDEDLTVEAALRPHCNISIGAFKVGIDHTGRVTSGLDNIEVILEGSKFVGANVNAGVGHAGNIYGPVVGRGGVDVIAGVDTRSKTWNVNIEASASIGLGVAVSDDAQVACYPGAASANVDVRKLIQSDMAMEHVRAVLSNRR